MTRQLLSAALEDELRAHPKEKVSVRSLCQSADINRSTFYLHFETIEDFYQAEARRLVEHYPFSDRYGIIAEHDLQTAITYFQKRRATFTFLNRQGLINQLLLERIKERYENGELWTHQVDDETFMALTNYIIAGTTALMDYCMRSTEMDVKEQAHLLVRIQSVIRHLLD